MPTKKNERTIFAFCNEEICVLTNTKTVNWNWRTETKARLAAMIKCIIYLSARTEKSYNYSSFRIIIGGWCSPHAL